MSLVHAYPMATLLTAMPVVTDIVMRRGRMRE